MQCKGMGKVNPPHSNSSRNILKTPERIDSIAILSGVLMHGYIISYGIQGSTITNKEILKSDSQCLHMQKKE